MEWILKKKDGCLAETSAEVRKAVPEELDALYEMQLRIHQTMADPEQFMPNDKEELRTNIRDNLVVGVWVGQTPIALGIVRYDGCKDTNYAWKLDVPESDVPYWANFDTIVVDAAWRGNGLQRRLLEQCIAWRRPDIIGMGCTVSPKNEFSLRNVQSCGFTVHTRKLMYGTHDRYVLRCPLAPLPGRYRHFKGNFYQVVDMARHSETTEPMVVYRALYADHSLWVRPASMWFEHVDRDDYHGPRFTYVGE